MANIVRAIRKETLETLRALKLAGIRFNVTTPVDHRVELFYEYEKLNGTRCIDFVAEVDGYGNIVEWGQIGGAAPRHESNAILTPEEAGELVSHRRA